MKIYLVHQISGLTEQQVAAYYDPLIKCCKSWGYETLFPMDLRETASADLTRFGHIIFTTDKWFVQSADVVYASFVGCTQVSIGSMMELAWAHILGKHVVVAMENNNLHQHPFVLEAASVVFNNEKSAKKHLKNLIKGVQTYD